MEKGLIPVKVTSRAAEEVKKIFSNKQIPDGYRLRVGMKGGGCGAAGFFLGFDKEQEHDQIYEIEGLEVLIDKRHIMYLLDLELDFEERRDEQGFVFNKP
ncbi:iron-sulfur cluster biosynthesis family protein [Limibacter armeniacum]|uniref:HesB/IscA family protein n=1 Tax=Limibacter armeniacum TaxID=466084 RepID=UPI002FE68163